MAEAVSLPDGRAPIAAQLARETGITEAQARELVLLLGANWASLVREARFLSKGRPTNPGSP
jgi:hypothetical protein